VEEAEIPLEVPVEPVPAGIIEEEVEEKETAEEEVEEVEGELFVPPPAVVGKPEEGKSQIRFAEDIMAPRRSDSRPDKSKKKKKGGGRTKESGDDAVKARKGRRGGYETTDEDEEFF
jgi:hypothetical protein